MDIAIGKVRLRNTGNPGGHNGMKSVVQNLNTENFIKQITKLFETSTIKHPKVIAPLINYSKDDIVRIAIEDGIPLELLRSCYSDNDKHCGSCESCHYLKRALANNNCDEYIKILFGEYDN